MENDARRIEERMKEIKDEEYQQNQKNPKKKRYGIFVVILIIAVIMVITWFRTPTWVASLEDVPPYSKDAYVVINRNVPDFQDDQLVTECYVQYSELDALGRAGAVMACIGPESMVSEARPVPEEITPAGFCQASYDFVEGGLLYVRTELIGNQMTGQVPSEKNVVAGTAMQTSSGLRYIENLVAREISQTGNHVICRVTPIYEGDNLVADGFTVEAISVEDQGESVGLYLYIYNAQSGVTIDYATGESKLAE